VVRDLFSEVRNPGAAGAPGWLLWTTGRAVLTVVVASTNLIGVAAVLAIVYLVIPLPQIAHAPHVKALNALTAAVCVAVAVPVGIVVGTHQLLPLRRWLRDDRPATPGEQRLVLVAPLRLFMLQLACWSAVAVAFAVLDSRYSTLLAVAVVAAILIAGTATGTCAYLLVERLLRPAAVRALAGRVPDQLAIPGVATRSVLAWALGSGLPVVAIVAVGALYLSGGPARPGQLAEAMVALGAIALGVGLLAVTMAARATAGPLDEVRRALVRVERGQLDTRVPVYDGTQIGRLQLGFNRMAEGLADREHLRQAFGTYLDPDVAERILSEQDVRLEADQVEVSVMFLDVRDFTSFAETHAASDVVEALNALFERVVPVIHRHGGRVDKFVGDGLLAVFGAPRRLADHAPRAVTAALEIADTAGPHGLPFGIGVNTGTVMAGNLGGAGRLEFSVIGDAVNVAARVEAATRQTGDVVLVGQRTREQAGDLAWTMEPRPGVVLKGKHEEVLVFAPRWRQGAVRAPGEPGGAPSPTT
jgi:adenylate cyclase